MRDPLDDQLTALVSEFDAMAVPAWHRLSVEAARHLEDDLFTPEDPPPVEVVRNLGFEGPDGTVPVRVYRDAEPPAPVVVFYHGGGWTLGGLDSAGDICRVLARRAGVVVVSVDYRLAPEHPFPAPLDDAYAALEWAADAAPGLGGDPGTVHVAGTSAGGGLAAAVARRAHAHDGPHLASQVLAYPMLDRDPSRDSYAENADGPLLVPEDVAWFWDQYLRSPVDAANPYAAALRAREFGGLPPATVVTAGHDPLRDEGVAYADRLAAAGVPVAHVHEPSLAHGFLSLTDDVDAADGAFDAVADHVRSPPR